MIGVKQLLFCSLIFIIVFGLNACHSGLTETVLYKFKSGRDGHSPAPYGALIQDSHDNFYGMTQYGGVHNQGTVFKLSSNGTETILHSFGGKGDGAHPQGSLILGSDGNFYGMTRDGGAHQLGTIFNLTPEGTETVLYSFAGGAADGAHPYGNLIQDSSGNFYGMTFRGGHKTTGTIFELSINKNSVKEKVLHTFGNDINDGAMPFGNLIQDSNGNLYGMTQYGGTYSQGTVFKLSTKGTESILHSFGGTGDGAYPDGSLILDKQGNLYGVTSFGGSKGMGTLFKLSPQGTMTVLHSFGVVDNDGTTPSGVLLQGNKGNFYGKTNDGGSNGLGTVFEYTLQGKVIVLHSFESTFNDTLSPTGNLILGNDGNLYGMGFTSDSKYQDIVYKLTLPRN